jgi:hypothetical protein
MQTCVNKRDLELLCSSTPTILAVGVSSDVLIKLTNSNKLNM